MSKPAKPTNQLLDADDVKTKLINTAISSYCLGAITGLLAYHFLARPAVAVEIPRTVPAVMIAVGQKLCDDWSGLRNIARVASNKYTFTCERYAEFKELEVK